MVRVKGGGTSGVYHLVLRLERPARLGIGRLGSFDFPAGWYVYTGSAMNGLEARIARHRRERKRLWWHIDYFLRAAEIVEVVAVPTRRRVECARHRRVMRLAGASMIAPGFGASDCRCGTHLAYSRKRPRLSQE